MEAPIFLNDSYAQECDAKIAEMPEPKKAVLDKNLFYPRGGGQPSDKGQLVRGSEIFNVLNVEKKEGKIIHELDREGLAAGDSVHCKLEWKRRHALMRMHTAAHILAGMFAAETGALITGNQLEEDRSRFDFSLENFDRAKFDELVQKANEIIAKGIELKIYSLPREEAMKIPGIVKLAAALPPAIAVLRIVEIPGADIQADGGTHVKNTFEIGKIEILKLDNKGAANRRIYFTLK
ncbi:Alanyl-tRNA editing protein AlaX-M [uncultured archaeon]|nr:Alanyl-tRNA editing protein AlaX-M [uncultured archaeon]